MNKTLLTAYINIRQAQITMYVKVVIVRSWLWAISQYYAHIHQKRL